MCAHWPEEQAEWHTTDENQKGTNATDFAQQ